jgi:ornithine cyclodeaminase/alanine dehydrogenase-like protein (mu-crystallin family)
MEVIDAPKLRRILPMQAAIDALDQALTTRDLPEAPPRKRLNLAQGEMLVMPAWGQEGLGIKLVTVHPSNPHRGLPLVQGIYVLFDRDTLAPKATIDGAALTAIRTAAVSAVATKYLARPEAENLVIFGGGVQAQSHLYAMQAVRKITKVTVVSRGPSGARLAAEAGAAGVKAVSGDPDSVAEADIVCTCTTSEEPVFDGALLKDGAHVNAVGAHGKTHRELDGGVMARAAVVAVETRESALAEAGDVVIALEEGSLLDGDIMELKKAIAIWKRKEADISVFKSVGVAFEDLIVAAAALARVRD